jgi:hypothetical protein
MSHMQMSQTRTVPEAWRDLSDAESDAQLGAIYGVIGAHGGDPKVIAFSPADGTFVSVIEYPDLMAAKQTVAGILALGTLEFVSIQELWDSAEFTQLVRKAAASV